MKFEVGKTYKGVDGNEYTVLSLDENYINKILFENYVKNSISSSYEKQAKKNIEEVKGIIKKLI